jgi:hypothetical protein
MNRRRAAQAARAQALDTAPLRIALIGSALLLGATLLTLA